MSLRRIAKHLFAGRRQLRKYFSRPILDIIAAAIKKAEATHTGEIRFAVEAALDVPALLHKQTAQARAIEVFSQLSVWDTEHNNGVLIYLLLADRDIEIVADRGIHQKVGQEEWENICRAMEIFFKDEDFERGVLHGIQAIGALLETHFPADDLINELPDQPVILH